jgi:hypothetical protein
MDGTVGARNVKSDVNVGFDSIWDNLDFGAMGAATLSKGNWVFVFDGVYARLEEKHTFSDGRGGVVSSNMGIADFAIGYTLVRTKIGNDMPLTLTPAVGVRYTYLQMSLNPNQFPTFSDHEDWWDPYVGGQVVLGLNRKLDWRTQGSVGGFSVGSDFTWSVGSFIDWHLNKTFTLDFGYRAIGWDYQNGGFTWDVTMHGPWVGLVIEWF